MQSFRLFLRPDYNNPALRIERNDSLLSNTKWTEASTLETPTQLVHAFAEHSRL